MVEVVFENFVNYLRSGNTDKLNIISFQQNQQHKINLSTQLIFYRILTKTVVQLTNCGIAQVVLGSSNFVNLSISGSQSGINTFGFIFENRGVCKLQNISYSLVSSGSTYNCGFVQFNTGSGEVFTSNISFVDLEDRQSIGLLSHYSGQCSCMPDSTLISGLCHCTPGSVPDQNVCKCLTQNAFIQNEACVCGVNATNTSNSCICPINSNLINGICKCSVQKQAPVNGVCQCFTQFAFVVGNSCECPVNSTNISNVCTCPSNSILINGVCKCQTKNSFPNDDRSQCICPVDAKNNTVSNVCECPALSIFIESRGACVCQLQYTDMENSKCVCSQNLMKGSFMQNGVCACPYSAVYDGNTCKCTIRGSTLEGTQCRCTEDQSGRWYSQGNRWCKNHGKCCTDCKKPGKDFNCYGDMYSDCDSPNGDVIM
ncbi:Conserved_hypothetical protein [Hexamita inflata]|uniref:Uncharacterized protein n=1 Tax=Hexamita inflata TaxID=28002 RepID=A0AA86U133_9EUKA|nr:Conserved hypothetical protein [Hexamita inflata]